MVGPLVLLALVALQSPPPPPLLNEAAPPPSAESTLGAKDEPNAESEPDTEQAPSAESEPGAETQSGPAAEGRAERAPDEARFDDDAPPAAEPSSGQADLPPPPRAIDARPPPPTTRALPDDEPEEPELDELYERSSDDGAPTAQRRARSSTTEAPPPEEVALQDPISAFLEIDPVTFMMHAGLSCVWAVAMLPVVCVPCVWWLLYPAAVGFGVDFIGKGLTDKRAGIIGPSLTFLISEVLGAVLGLAALFVGAIALTALALIVPSVTSVIGGSTASPLFVLTLYGSLGVGMGVTLVLSSIASTATWYVLARDDRGDALLDALTPGDDDEELGPRPRASHHRHPGVVAMRF